MAFTEIVNAENSPVIGETVDGYQTVESGGITSGTTIVGGGTQSIEAGGVSDLTAVESGASIYVAGTATNVTATGGEIDLEGGLVQNIVLNSGSLVQNTAGALTSATVTSATITDASVIVNAQSVIWDNIEITADTRNYITFGLANTVRNLNTTNNVAFSSDSVVENLWVGSGAVMVNYNGAVMDHVVLQGSLTSGFTTWCQVGGGIGAQVSNVQVLGNAKWEASGASTVTGMVVDATGVEGVEFKKVKVGAALIVYNAAATVNDLTLQNGGSAHVYNGGTVNNVTVKDGGALYMVNYGGGEPSPSGYANNVTITATGSLWYKGGTMNNLRIQSGATLAMETAFTDKINGVFENLPDGIGSIAFSLNGDGTGSYVVMSGTSFLGNYTNGGGVAGTVNLSSLWVFEGASLVGWNLGASTVNGKYVDGDGVVHEMVMGGTTAAGGRYAENVYLYKGSAVLGTGTTEKINVATGLIVDNSLFVCGNMTSVTDLIFRNGACIQTYSNSYFQGVNEDVASDSIYRNFSISGGVVSGFIIDNGGFIQLMTGNTTWVDSPTGSATDVLVQGVRTASGGNYNATMMTQYGGGSVLILNSATVADNVIVQSGGWISTSADGTIITNLTVGDGGNFNLILGGTSYFQAQVINVTWTWDSSTGVLSNFVWGSLPGTGTYKFAFNAAGKAALKQIDNLVIVATGWDATTPTVYNDAEIYATTNLQGGNTYNNLFSSDCTVVMYADSTINGYTISGGNAFLQFTAGTANDVQLVGGKYETAGTHTINGIFIDGTLFNTPIGDTGDSSPTHQTTQLVAYASGTTVHNIWLQSGGSAFFYNGATIDATDGKLIVPGGELSGTTEEVVVSSDSQTVSAGAVVAAGGVLYLTNWALDGNTSCVINGDLWITSGGNLWLGGANNVINGTIQTMSGANIIGIAEGANIRSIVLRDANIVIDDKLTITDALQDGNQTIVGGRITNWINTRGVLTMSGGTIDNYVAGSAGQIVIGENSWVTNLDLTANTTDNYIYGGLVKSGAILGGLLTDSGAVSEIEIQAFTLGGSGTLDLSSAKVGTLTVTGGNLILGGTATVGEYLVTGGVIDIYTAVTGLVVENAQVVIHNPAGSVDGLTATNVNLSIVGEATDAVLLNNASIAGAGSVVATTFGTATNITVGGGVYTATGASKINGIAIDGTAGDPAKLVASGDGVAIDGLNIVSGGEAYAFGGATLGSGTTIGSGGTLYLTDESLASDTIANINADIKVYGTLYLGSISNVFADGVRIQTYGGSTVTGMQSGTIINDIVLRGANINIVDGITINAALQGGNQSIDGGYVKTWTNNFGVLTLNDGRIDTYIHNNGSNAGVYLQVNGGSVGYMNLASHAGTTRLFGGVVESATIGGGTVSDSELTASGAHGIATISNVTLTGGQLNIWYNGSTADNVLVNGGLLQVGRRGGVYDSSTDTHSATASDVTMISGTTRIDGIVDGMVMSGGLISLAGGTIDGIDIYGGTIVNWMGITYSGTINDANVYARTGLSGNSIVWNNLNIQVMGADYITFGALNTFNNLKSNNKVSFGSGSVVNGATFDSGAVVVGGNTTYNAIVFHGNGTWAQIGTNAIVNGLDLYDRTKFEANGATIKMYDVLADASGAKKADGSDIQFGDQKEGANLVVYAAGAVASGVTMINHGSATVFKGGKVEDFIATEGGALYLRGWSVSTTDATGIAENGTITATGGIWYGGGTLRNVTIEYGAWKKFDYCATSVMENVQIGQEGGGYVTINCNIAAGTGTLVLTDGDTFCGNWTSAGGVGTPGAVTVEMTDKATLMGWNLGTAKISGTVALSGGGLRNFYMGGTNIYGGFHAQGAYFYNGSAVLGSGSATVDTEGNVTFKYNTADDLYFDGGLFVMGGITIASNLTFVNHVSFQGYSNGNMNGVNLDEAEGSIYRNFSMSGGVTSGAIIENGGFLQLFYAGQNWQGNTPSPAGTVKDVIVRGRRDAAWGNYNATSMTTYGGGSFIIFANGTGGDNVTFGSGTVARFSSDASVTNMTMESGSIVMFDALGDTSNISGTNEVGAFVISGTEVDGLVLNGPLSYLKFADNDAEFAVTNLTVNGNATVKSAGIAITGMTINNARSYFAFDAGSSVGDLTVNGSLVNFGGGSVFSDVTLSGDNTVGIMYSYSEINGLTFDANTPLVWVQFTAGIASDVQLLAGKYEAAGGNFIYGITVDGTNYHTAIGDTGDTSPDHLTTQLVAYSEDVSVYDMRITNYGSAFLYNGAHAIGSGNLTVTRASDGYVFTTSAGAVVESGGVLYMTNWDLSSSATGGMVFGDLWVGEGGTLYLGTSDFYINRIQTLSGATITGIVEGTVIDSMILRGANILIDEKLTIYDVIQGNDQSVDGGYVGTWTNNFGVLSMSSGTIDKYVANNAGGAKLVMSGGTIHELDLSKSTVSNVINGGTIENVTLSLAGGSIANTSIDPEVDTAIVINGITINGNGGYVSGTWSWDGGSLNLFSKDSVANNVIINGGVASIGRRSSADVVSIATVNNVTMNSGMLRVDGIANNLEMSGGTLSVYGGTINGLTVYGGTIANYGTYRGTITNVTLSSRDKATPFTVNAGYIDWNNVTVEAGFNNYTRFGAKCTIDGLYAHSNVNVGDCTSVKNVSIYDGAILVNYGGAAIEKFTINGNGKGTWAQCTTGSVDGLYVFDNGKYEAAGTNQVNNAMVDGWGVDDVAFKDIKVAANLVLYAEGVVANNVELLNYGSAMLYNGATLNNAVAYDGGAVYMVDYNGNTPAVGGILNDAVIRASGRFWFKAGVVNNITIEWGATTEMTVKFTDKFSGTYTNVAGIGDLGFNLKGDGTGSFVAAANTTFIGNWGAGGGVSGTPNLSALWVFEGASLVGWNLGASVVNGKYVDGEGTIHNMVMGADNEFGGKSAQNVYIYNGSAVLGSGSATVDGEGNVTFKYNTAKGLIFDNSLFVLGGMTQVTDTTFRNNVCLQTYSNANLSGVNYDEAEDSIYRNFSITNGVASGVIIENGGFINLFYAGQNWGGNTPSPAGSLTDVIIRGSRSVASGNYSQSMMDTYGGASLAMFSNGTSGQNVTIGSGAMIVQNVTSGAGNLTIDGLTIEDGAFFRFNNLNADTAITNATFRGEEFSVVGGVATGIVLDDAKNAIGVTGNGMTLADGTFTAGTLAITGSDLGFAGTTYLALAVDSSKISRLAGDFTAAGIDLNFAAGALTSTMTSLTIDGGTFATQDNNMYGADVTFKGGAQANWVGGSIGRAGSASTITVDGEGTLLNMSWQHSGWGAYETVLNITDGAQVNVGAYTYLTTVNIDTKGGLYVSDNPDWKGSIGTINVTEGWVQLDGVTNTYAANVNVVGSDYKTYFQVIGASTGAVKLTGAGGIYVGSGKWGEGSMSSLTVNTGDKTVGTVSLRNGSLNNLNMNGGSFYYNGSYMYEDVTGDVVMYGAAKFINAAIYSGEDNTIVVDGNSLDSFWLGNYTSVYASVDASSVNDITLGAEIDFAQGVTVTVGHVEKLDFSGVKSFVSNSVLATSADNIVVTEGGSISIDTITVHTTEGVYNLGNIDNLNIADGITVKVGASQSAVITAFNESFLTNELYSTTMTCKITVDANNNAQLSVFRTSSADKVAATWPATWVNAPIVNIPVTAEDIATYAVDGVLGLQEAGPAAQGRFLYKDPANNTNNNLALIGAAASNTYIVGGMMKPNQWGGRANTWLQVEGAQRVTVIGGGTAAGGTISTASNIYVTGSTTSATIYGAGGAGFTVANVNIAIDGGAAINRLYGGGYADGDWSQAKVITGQTYGGDVTGNIVITADNASFARIVSGGGYGNVGGNITISINNATRSSANIYGGTVASSQGNTVGGDIMISLTNGQFSGLFAGGSFVTGSDIESVVNGNVTMIIDNTKQYNNYKSDFTDSAWVIGGGYALNGGTSKLMGKVDITIVDSTVGFVVGGGAASETGSVSFVGGDIAIMIKNSIVTGNVFGGGYANGYSNSICGNTAIVIDSSDFATTIYGNIYAGGRGTYAEVEGAASITFTGSAYKLNFSGVVSGDGNYAAVGGDTTLAFDDFTGEFMGTIKNFDDIMFSGDTAVELGFRSITISNLDFDLAGRNVDLATAALVSGGEFEFAEDASLNILSADVFTGNANFILMDDITDEGVFEDATVTLKSAESEVLGSFKLGESLTLEGYGTFTADLTDGMITLDFEKAQEETQSKIKGLLA
ncbi:MAG: hypothetical protein VB042_05445 [Victivallaceae bacterium]|nr:hypothetical protein [Victivallaceae bacterium]